MAKKPSLKTATGLTALATAAGAAYYLYGEGGRKHRAQISLWTEKAKKDLGKKLGPVKIAGTSAWNKAHKDIMEYYKKMKGISPEELALLGTKLKKHADQLAKDLKAIKTTKKTVAKKKRV